MKILALEFSAAERTAAIVSQEAGAAAIMLREARESGSRTIHAFRMIESVLNEAGIKREEIDQVALGLGPGSYTGIRASIALAQGWQLARGTPCQGISSVDCIAEDARAAGLLGNIAIVIDAQRNEFCVGRFAISAESVRQTEPLRLVDPATVRQLEDQGFLLVGPEINRTFPAAREIFPRAGTLGRLALVRQHLSAAEELEPIYLRETTFVKAPPPRRLTI